MAEPDGDILTLDEVAADLKSGERTVYWFVASGEIPAFKLGEIWRFQHFNPDRQIIASISETKHERRK